MCCNISIPLSAPTGADQSDSSPTIKFISGKHFLDKWLPQYNILLLFQTANPNKMFIQGYYKRNRHFQRYVVSKPLAEWTHNLRSSVEDRVFVPPLPVSLNELKQHITNNCCKCWRGYAQVCLDRIRLSYWYLSCDKRLTHRTFVT